MKKFFFYYWFAFPSFTWPSCVSLISTQAVTEVLIHDQLESLHQQHLLRDQKSCFIIRIQEDGGIKLHDLHEFSIIGKEQVYAVAFSDPSSSSVFPGWPARNLLAYLVKVHAVQNVKLLSYRVRGRDAGRSLLFDVRIDESCREIPAAVPSSVGWEKNEAGKILPRTVDMSHVLDPVRLAQNAVHLNLKLMRWRLVPSLDLEKVAGSKCLLLGSGTLGCNVARALLGWGIQEVTFVDNSKVSFSNPVRQSLFHFEDCLNGGADKAETAAASLRRIYPGVKSIGINMSIPMPGHSVTPERTSVSLRNPERQVFFVVAGI